MTETAEHDLCRCLQQQLDARRLESFGDLQVVLTRGRERLWAWRGSLRSPRTFRLAGPRRNNGRYLPPSVSTSVVWALTVSNASVYEEGIPAWGFKGSGGARLSTSRAICAILRSDPVLGPNATAWNDNGLLCNIDQHDYLVQILRRHVPQSDGTAAQVLHCLVCDCALSVGQENDNGRTEICSASTLVASTQ